MSFQYGFWNWYYRRNGASGQRRHERSAHGHHHGLNSVAATRQHEGRKGVKGGHELV
jgi:hypothetical protein